MKQLIEVGAAFSFFLSVNMQSWDICQKLAAVAAVEGGSMKYWPRWESNFYSLEMLKIMYHFPLTSYLSNITTFCDTDWLLN